ncbi:MAG: Nuclease SbcCD, D subunit [candidate division TM6 bacterium GW2011_GWF2_43_17]|nr:MAG: Nuclease SbcCD, D subunit [candidate division TM6 bacterium GW2011_GWF2_43_17]HAU30689.1 hypothetical protein [Candidatus Dependentiae bacterium]
MITFVHTADLHYGVENYGRVDPQTGIHTRLLDFHNAFSFVVTKAIEHNVDFFLMCGDAYKTAHPTPTQQRLLLENLLRLYQAKIPVILIVGNHDIPGSFGKSHTLDLFDKLPVEGFHVVSKPTLLIVSTKNGPVQIIGIPWPTRNTLSLNQAPLSTRSGQITQEISRLLSTEMQKLAAQLNPHNPAILAGHLTASTGTFSGSEKCATTGQDPIFLPSQLALPGIDYIALGHLHRYQQVNPAQTPPIVYSGSVERIDFGEIKDTKGFCLVTIPNKSMARVTFVPTPVRPFVEIRLTLNATTQPTQQLVQEIARHNIHKAIVKITYIIPPDVTQPVDLKAIHAACSHAHHIACIIPIVQNTPRPIRARLSTQMSTQESLVTFLQTQEVSEGKIKRIQQKLQRIIDSSELPQDTLIEQVLAHHRQEPLIDQIRD